MVCRKALLTDFLLPESVWSFCPFIVFGHLAQPLTTGDLNLLTITYSVCCKKNHMSRDDSNKNNFNSRIPVLTIVDLQQDQQVLILLGQNSLSDHTN